LMDIPTLLPVLASLIAIGGFAGFLAGLLGVGGGIVLVPAFFYAFQSLGYDGPQLMQVCLATSLATIIVTSIRSTQSHHKKGAVDWQILRQWAPGIAVGAHFWRGFGCQFAIADLAADLSGVWARLLGCIWHLAGNLGALAPPCPPACGAL
jgi:hypothetical protein